MEGVIDAHVHYIPKLKGAVRGGKVENLGYGRVRFPDGREASILPVLCVETSFQIETLLHLMDRHGVERSVLIQGPVYGEFNAEVSQQVKARPDRFVGSILVDPESRDAVEQISKLTLDRNVRVLKFECSEATGLMGLHPDLTFDAPAFRAIWAKASEAALTGVIDPGSINGPAYQVEALERVVSDYPRVHFVIAHLGFPEPAKLQKKEDRDRWWSMIRLARSPNVWLEISAMPYFYAEENYPFGSAIELIASAKEEVGPEKLIWGSDIPGTLQYATYGQMIDFIDRNPGFTDREKRLIFRENAMQAYSLPAE